MFTFGIFIILICSAYLILAGLFQSRIKRIKADYYGLQNLYNELLQRCEKYAQDNKGLEVLVQETTAIYNITKEIYKYLDVNKTIKSCKDQIIKYIGAVDCDFIAGDIDPMQYRDYSVYPLLIGQRNIGHLVASSVKENEREKFSILAHQFMLGIKRAHLYEKVQELAITDSLTGVFKRRYYIERLNEEIERSKRFNLSFSLLMVDVDHFKEQNDHYGHLVGDAIIKEVSRAIKENIRQIDLLGRYGGEEFSIILTETAKAEAKFVSERIRQSIEDRRIRVYDEDLKVTISIGMSSYPSDAGDADSLIEKSDEALYKAKNAGRNQVCVYGS